MNPITTALIAEDEPLLAESLRQDLATLWPELQIIGMATHGEAALSAALAQRPQLLFLDIRMPGMSGLEVAQALAEDWPDDGSPFPLLVFVTAYDQYALQAFERAAQDYLLKPVQRERLAQTCARLQSTLRQRDSSAPSATSLADTLQQLQRLIGTGTDSVAAAAAPPLRLLQASSGQTIHMVPVDEVLYFEAADKYVRVITANKEHLIRISLRELLPQLDTQRFWQVHRAVVVRADAIERAVREESGKLTLHLRGHTERLGVSRMFAHLFKGL
jgi:DNA-binding LytR/AlgR family response regulator